jgi:endo-1,4-beta-xylanase
LSEQAYASTLAREFNMIEAQDAMKWRVVRPTRETLDFRPADRIVEFAQANRIKVRGHTLVWGRSNPFSINEYIRDPRALHALLQDRIRRVADTSGARCSRGTWLMKRSMKG